MSIRVLYVRGGNGTARFLAHRTEPNRIVIRCVNDNWTVQFDPTSDSDAVQALVDLQQHVVGTVGQPTLIADLSSFFQG